MAYFNSVMNPVDQQDEEISKMELLQVRAADPGHPREQLARVPGGAGEIPRQNQAQPEEQYRGREAAEAERHAALGKLGRTQLPAPRGAVRLGQAGQRADPAVQGNPLQPRHHGQVRVHRRRAGLHSPRRGDFRHQEPRGGGAAREEVERQLDLSAERDPELPDRGGLAVARVLVPEVVQPAALGSVARRRAPGPVHPGEERGVQ